MFDLLCGLLVSWWICEIITSRCCSGVQSAQSVWNPSVTYSHGCVFPMCIFLYFLCLFAFAFLCSVIDSASQDCLEFLTSSPSYYNVSFLSAADLLDWLLIPLSLPHVNVSNSQSLSTGLCWTSLVTSVPSKKRPFTLILTLFLFFNHLSLHIGPFLLALST